MKIHFGWQKRFYPLLILIFFMLVLTGCDWFKDLFKKDGSPEVENISETGSLNIGPDGGTVILNNIEIKVPAGAFNEENEVNISMDNGSKEFGDLANSGLYEINGLPETINNPIQIKLKYNDAISGDPVVAIGEMQYSSTVDSFMFSYYLDDAVDSSGYLVYTLPANAGLTKSSGQNYDALKNFFKIIAPNTYTRRLTNEMHFVLHYPKKYEQEVIKMGEYFEEAYRTCKQMGFQYYGRDRSAVVLVKPIKNYDGQYLYWNSRIKNNPNVTDAELQSLINFGRFNIDYDILSDNDLLRVTVGHEFMHLIQNSYEFSSPDIEIEQDWLAEATSVWMEEEFSAISNYISSNLDYKEFNPFLGLQNAAGDYGIHGYGLAPVIKDIVGDYGVDAVVQIFEKIMSGTLPASPVDPVDALLSVINESVGTYWHSFLSYYTLGQYYNNKVNFRFLDQPDRYKSRGINVYDGMEVIEPANSQVSFDRTYHDLSGKLFKVVPGDFSSMDKVPLRFKVDDPVNCGILVCKYKKGTEISLLGEVLPDDNGEVLIDDAKPVFENGYELIAMVSNCTADKNQNYQGTNDVELTVEIASDDLNSLLLLTWLNTLFIRINIWSQEEGMTDTDVLDALDSDMCDCTTSNSGFSLNGKKYSFSGSRDDNNRYEDCNLEITFSDDRTNIEYFKIYKHYIDPHYSSGLTQELEYEIVINESIPITTTDLDQIKNDYFIQYQDEKGPGSNFDFWAKEYIYNNGGSKDNSASWTYYDTKGDQRYLKVRITFSLP